MGQRTITIRTCDRCSRDVDPTNGAVVSLTSDGPNYRVADARWSVFLCPHCVTAIWEWWHHPNPPAASPQGAGLGGVRARALGEIMSRDMIDLPNPMLVRLLRERDHARAEIDALRGELGFKTGEGLDVRDLVAAVRQRTAPPETALGRYLRWTRSR